MGDDRDRRAPDPALEPEHDDLQVQSIPLDTEDGGTVVIEQQNAGPGQQVGAGEFKETDEVSDRKSPDQAAAEQAELEDRAPVNDAPSDE